MIWVSVKKQVADHIKIVIAKLKGTATMPETKEKKKRDIPQYVRDKVEYFENEGYDVGYAYHSHGLSIVDIKDPTPPIVK